MPGPPRSYDEITARTVPDPDSSWRPTKEQQREALSRVELPRDEALFANVQEALRELGADHLSIETDGERVTLHGPVADMATWRRIDNRVRAVEGVRSVDNRTHVR
jgi:osmotically-inducible protein OsmY